MVIYSVGHSNRSIEEFFERLLTYGIERVVDVRTIPYSRFSPQYNQIPLSRCLEAYGIVYDFKGKNLGGKGENVNYDSTLARIAELGKTQNVVLMCSEADYKKCHRYLMLTPDLEKLGATIEHISY